MNTTTSNKYTATAATTTTATTTTAINIDDVDTIIKHFCIQQRQLLEVEYNMDTNTNTTATTATTTHDRNSNNDGEISTTTTNATPPLLPSRHHSSSSVSRSSSLNQLDVHSVSIGLYGRTVVEFILRQQHLSPINEDETKLQQHQQPPSSSSSSSVLLPAHRFTTGDDVELQPRFNHQSQQQEPQKRVAVISAVVCQVTDTSISVAISSSSSSSHSNNNNNNNNNNNKATTKKKTKKQDTNANNDTTNTSMDDDELWNTTNMTTFTMVPKSQRIIYDKLLQTIHRLEQQQQQSNSIRNAMFVVPPTAVVTTMTTSSVPIVTKELLLLQPPTVDDMTTTTQSPPPPVAVQYQNPNLDDSQKEAIQFALSSSSSSSENPIALIHGPPGTGKTTTLVELIYQAITHYKYTNILVTAPSNVAVDNILSRLVSQLHTSTIINASNSKAKSSTNKKSVVGQPPSSYSKNHPTKLRMVRIGHPARIQSDIQHYSLDALVQTAEGTEIVQEVRKELQSHINTLQQQSSSKGGWNSSKRSSGGNSKTTDSMNINKRLLYQEMKALRKEIRVREETIVNELLQNAHVVVTTCVGAATLLHTKRKRPVTRNGNDAMSSSSSPMYNFDIVIIDEAAQSIEAACWIPILLATKKVILAGDHLQLPPTILTHHPLVRTALQRTMFERLMELYNPVDAVVNQSIYNVDNIKSNNGGGIVQQHPISRMLKVQYRMNERIANWASQALYNNELQTHCSVQHHTLDGLDGVNVHGTYTKRCDDDDDVTQMPLLFIDTADCQMYESTNSAGSRYNHGESQIVLAHVQRLLSVGVNAEQIAVISPYNGQVELLKSILLMDVAPTIQIRSVDGFQGGEREAVIISLVRSSPKGGRDGIGFLSDNRRLNVAITRAKRHCCVIGDSDTVRQSPLIRNFIDWVEQHGEQRSAFEVVSDLSPNETDILEAERMMQHFMDSAKPRNDKKERKQFEISGSCSDPVDTELRRKSLYNRVQMFVSQKKPGDEMILASELTKLDRKLVHEIAEELGLEHASAGVDGVDRRITIRIPRSTTSHHTTVNPVSSDQVSSQTIETDPASILRFEKEDPVNVIEVAIPVSVPPEVLESSEHSITTEIGIISTVNNTNTKQSVSGLNSVLGSLARERAERESQRQQLQISEKRKKGKGKKLGGSYPPPLRPTQGTVPPVRPVTNASIGDDDDDDDMAFLDTQIEVVQNSHGRNVIGSGKDYRSIINGVLIARPPKPKPQIDVNNSSKSTTLNAKLKAAQDSRRSKTKKK